MTHEELDGRTIRIGRRDFTAAGILALLSGVAISVSGCGGGGGSSSPTSPSTGTPAAGGDKTGSVSSNHGHTAVLTAAQLQAGGAVALNIRGTSAHPHTVNLTAAQVASIAGGTRVAQTSSSDDGHTHDVTFN
jgi:hypothetical protein